MSENPFKQSLGHAFIIGGCGFLGSHIVELLLERHPQTKVSIVDLRDSPNRDADRTDFYGCDITDSTAVEDIFLKCKPDVVIHTASPTAHGGTKIKEEIMLKVNVDGTNVLLEAAKKSGVTAFVYTSSASVVTGTQEEYINVDERWPLVFGKEQPEYYTHTKAVAEEAVLSANRTPAKFLTCAIRPAGIFGERDVQLIPGMMTASRKGQSKFQLGPNDNLFDFTYVRNIAHAHLLAAVGLLTTAKLNITPLDTEKIDGEAFFITNDSPVYFWDFARRVWKEGGDTVAVNPAKVWVLGTGFALMIATIAEFVLGIFGKTPNLDRPKVRYSVMTRYYNISKAKQRLGYFPIVKLEDGIRKGVKAWLDQEAEGKTGSAAKKAQ